MTQAVPRSAKGPISSRWLTIALACFFFVFGFTNAAWVVRIPDIRNILEVNAAILGFLFLAGAIGAMISLVAAPVLISRLSTRWGLLLGLIVYVLGGLIAAGALLYRQPLLLAAGNFIAGAGAGLADVSVNVESTELEKRAGRSLMPQLHGAFSVGTLIGALAGSLAIVVGINVPLQSVLVSVMTVVILCVFFRFIPRGTGQVRGEHAQAQKTAPGERRANWRNPRLILLGLVIFGGSVTEGGANDWLALAMVDDYKISAQSAAITFAVLVGAMSIVRLSGGWIVDRLGRPLTLRFFAALGIAGVLLVILGAPNPLFAWTGAALWGAGVALAFPLTISAAADGPNSSGRVAVVTAFGYAAFLVAPPLLGILAQATGLLNMFWVFTALLGLVLIAAGAAKPLESATHK